MEQGLLQAFSVFCFIGGMITVLLFMIKFKLDDIGEKMK